MATLWRLKRHSATLTLYQLPDQRTERRSPLVRQSLDCLLGIAPRDAGLGVLSGRVAFNVYPGLKHPTSQSLRRGWLFGVTYHNMRGAIASATAAWANLFSRCAAIHASTFGLTLVPRRKCPNSIRGRGRPRHGRTSSSVRWPKTAWKLAKTPGASLAAARYTDSQSRNWVGSSQTPC